MTKVYVGNLPMDVRERDMDDLFSKFGKIVLIDVKSQTRPPAFAFVEFEDARDAAEAVRRRDGVEFMGARIRVEIAKGGTGQARENFTKPPSRGFRVTVKGLPRGCSWQDLKDHVRGVSRPVFTDVSTNHDGDTVGVVEFETHEDMLQAIRKLDDTEFKNARYDPGHYVRLSEEIGGGGGRGGGGGGRGRYDDRPPPRRSRSRSPPPRRGASPPDYRDRRDEGRDDDRREPPRGRAYDEPPRGRAPERGRSASRSRSRSRG